MTSESKHAATAARLAVAITRLNRQLRHNSPGGLTLSQWSALVTIESHQPLRIGDLAEHEGFSAPTATRLIAGLEEAGLVERTGGPTDRRIWYVALTDAGREKLTWARTVRTAALAQRLAGLPATDVDRLLDLLPLLESLVDD